MSGDVGDHNVKFLVYTVVRTIRTVVHLLQIHRYTFQYLDSPNAFIDVPATFLKKGKSSQAFKLYIQNYVGK